jgi:pimeloyl-ACP methyl ester carboxylesterase
MANVRDARLAVIADAGHMLHHDQPEAAAAAIESFMSESTPRR